MNISTCNRYLFFLYFFFKFFFLFQDQKTALMLAHEKRRKHRKEVVTILKLTGASGNVAGHLLDLVTFKNFIRNDEYLSRFRVMLKCALLVEDDETIKIVENNKSTKNPRSSILWELIRLLSYAQLGARYQEIESNDWVVIVKKLELTIEEILSLDMFDNEQRTTLMLFRNKEFHLIDLFDEKECLVGFCLNNDIKVLFNNALVNYNVDKIFRTTVGCEDGSDRFLKVYFPFAFFASSKSTPWILCLVDVISRIVYLCFIGSVCVYEYGSRYELDYSMSIHHIAWSRSEIVLAGMLFASIIHEVGEVCDVQFSWKLYFEDEWNIVDTLSYLLGVLWFILRCIPGQFSVARVLLNLHAIPEAISLLRYSFLYQSFGVLVIMVKAMILDLQAFIILFLVTLTGVAIAMRGLFYGVDGYNSDVNALLTIFSVTFSYFRFTSFNTSSTVVNSIGVFVLIGLLILVPIVYINLIIAQMTNSYQTVKNNALREWGFSKARLVKQYIRREDKNIFSAIPSPFNLLTAFLYAIGHFLSFLFQKTSGIFISYYNIIYCRFIVYLYGFIFKIQNITKCLFGVILSHWESLIDYFIILVIYFISI
jgi:hypothetical protein